MPKAKPSSILVHRIEAGEWERQNILRPVAEVAQTAKIVSTAALTIVCVGIGAAGYSCYWFLKWMADWGETAKQFWQDVGDSVRGQPLRINKPTADDPYGYKGGFAYKIVDGIRKMFT